MRPLPYSKISLGEKLSREQRLGIFKAITVDIKGLPNLIEQLVSRLRNQELEKELKKQVEVIKLVKTYRAVIFLCKLSYSINIP